MGDPGAHLLDHLKPCQHAKRTSGQINKSSSSLSEATNPADHNRHAMVATADISLHFCLWIRIALTSHIPLSNPAPAGPTLRLITKLDDLILWSFLWSSLPRIAISSSLLWKVFPFALMLLRQAATANGGSLSSYGMGWAERTGCVFAKSRLTALACYWPVLVYTLTSLIPKHASALKRDQQSTTP